MNIIRRILACTLCVLLAFCCCLTAGADETSESETVRKQYGRDELVCTYTFTVYGYGHGVGLSQVGAAVYGDANGRFRWNYVQILMHYYPETHMAFDEDVPQTAVRAGAVYNTRDLIARATMAEIGGYCTENRRETTKAQIVAIYTFLKHHNFSAPSGGIAYTSKTPNSVIYSCLDEVWGQYVAYADGSAATGLYAASCPSWTASSGDTWGSGIDYPGLEGGVYSPEDVSISTVTLDAADVVAIVNTYNAGKSVDRQIRLSGDPSDWLEIVEHDGAYSEHIGFVNKIRVGNQTMNGTAFRMLLYRTAGVPGLRSHCFSLTYDLVPGTDVRGNSSADYETQTEQEAE